MGLSPVISPARIMHIYYTYNQNILTFVKRLKCNASLCMNSQKKDAYTSYTFHILTSLFYLYFLRITFRVKMPGLACPVNQLVHRNGTSWGFSESSYYHTFVKGEKVGGEKFSLICVMIMMIKRVLCSPFCDFIAKTGIFRRTIKCTRPFHTHG